MDVKALYKISYGLFILSTKSDDKLNGCIINTAMQVTASPCRICVTVNKDNYTEKLIEKSKVFSISVLSKAADMDIIAKFGFESGVNVNKFENVKFEMKSDIPVVTEKTNAYMCCKVVSMTDVGTHIMIVGDVIDAEILSDDESLTYDYYHSELKGKTPKASPLSEVEQKGFKCRICGHVENVDELPDDYICPICKHPKEDFERIG